ncbi:hypothetical protein [Glutamicibacter uratoxydans]|uniref:hypothetical protein n=1 Tax=Glutamicibacter uratoxydans TaxID=43667 RepID=UPI003D6DC83D
MSSKVEERTKRATGHRRMRTLLVVLLAAAVLLALWLAQGAGWFGNQQSASDGQSGAEVVTIAELEAEKQVPPVLSFEDSKPSDWPEGETTGCTYVHEQFQKIADDVDARGLDAMRYWLDALDELEGDPEMDQYSQQFMEIKREWSTVLAAAEAEDADTASLLAQGEESLDKLREGTGCE